MARYLDVAGFRARTIMPGEDVDELELRAAGWLQTRIDDVGDEFDDQLRKRYDVPFGVAGTPRTSVPRTIIRWLVAIVTRDAYLKRGFNPASQQDEAGIFGTAARAEEQVALAANAETGLYELPLRADDVANAVTRGGPQADAQQSPYTWATLQRDDARDEDRST